MELLAPAGSPAHLIAALDAGADAVYLGGKRFSARKFAGNFSDEEMKEAVRMAHGKGASVYVTLNTLIGDMENKALAEYLQFLGTIPIDGLLVQDFGVVSMVRKIAPHIPLHASTQMTVSNLDGVRFLGDHGFQRVVLSRELSLAEIKEITDQTNVEIEVFVHGALCVCYSGQCLMSSFIGGRSGNRGSCAQPCRMPYELVDDAGRPLAQEKGKYILSLKDMMGLPRIPDLLAAHVSSLKVEGRMKSAEYVYNTVSAYRKAIDAAKQHLLIDTEPLELDLEEEFNRGYTTAYPDDTAGPSMITEYAPGNHGVEAGRVESIGRAAFVFKSEADRRLVDVTGISYETEERTIAFIPVERLSSLKKGKYRALFEKRPLAHAHVYWNVKIPKKSLAMKDLQGKIPLYLSLSATPGEALSLTAADDKGHAVTVMSDVLMEKAKAHVTSAEEIEKQMSRLGNTWFTLADISASNEGCMVPKSILNHLRQEAVESLLAKRREAHEAGIPRPLPASMTPAFSKVPSEEGAHVTVRTTLLSHVKEALAAGVRQVIFGGASFSHRPIPWKDYEEAVRLCHEAEAEILFPTPRVVREKYQARAQAQLRKLLTLLPDGVVLEYAGAIEWVKGEESLAVWAGPSMNIFNREAEKEIESLGFSGCFLSQELTIPQIRHIAKGSDIPLGAYVYGRTEMMISEYCAINAVMGDKDKKHCPMYCMRGRFALKDGEGRRFPIYTDEWCHMHIANCHVLDMRPYFDELKKAGLSALTLDVRGNEGSILSLCKDACDILCGRKEAPGAGRGDDVTRGHFFRGVL